MLPLILFLLSISLALAEKLYVVERERSSLAVVENGRLVKRIEALGNMNHATVKFWRGYAYVISRDGYLSKIDTKRDELVKRVKVGKSSIGVDFTDRHVIVANYDPDTVVVLDEELNVLREISTGSRNVGIKAYKTGFLFSLMDKDEVWWVREDGEVLKFAVGKMPFDALLFGDHYLVGFFKDEGIGLIDLKEKSYKSLKFKREGKEVVFKIPHFGTWGVFKDTAYVPAVGERKIYVVSLKDVKVLREIALSGLPVFVAVSPEGEHIAVNFSGDKENFVALYDLGSEKLLGEVQAGKRIMHLRFSKDGKRLYLTSYFESKLKVFEVPTLKLLHEVDIPNPSGVFLAK